MTLDEFNKTNNALRNEWFASYGGDAGDHDFIYDGATDPAQWLASPWRIMCLLKEAHGGGRWNHAEGIKEGGGMLKVGGTAKQATHYRMLEWLYAIETTLNHKPVDIEYERMNDYTNARQTMMRSAWVNIKKADGEAQSNNNDLTQVVKRDAMFLRRQLDLLNPKIILCGNIYGIVQGELFPDGQPVVGTASGFSSRQNNGRIIMNWFHPAARKNKDATYKEIISEVESLQKMKLL